MDNVCRPRSIRIEASSLCQLKCPSCPNASDAAYPAIGRGYLRRDDFERLLDDNSFIRNVELSNYGEMFLNPDLLGILRVAHERRVRLTADNGVNLNSVDEEQLEGLVRYRVRSLSCSLDGASVETYGRYRVNGDFDRVIRNIETINRYKQMYGSRYPLLTWQFIIFGHNEHEIPLAREHAHALGMGFRLKLAWDDSFSPVHDPDRVRREVGYASRSEYRLRHGIDQYHGICRMLWEQPQINWDGSVLGCSRNFWRVFSGNVFSDGLVPAVNTGDMIAARAMLSGEIDTAADAPCTMCEIYHDRVANSCFVNRNWWAIQSKRVLNMLRLNPLAWRFRNRYL